MPSRCVDSTLQAQDYGIFTLLKAQVSSPDLLADLNGVSTQLVSTTCQTYGIVPHCQIADQSSQQAYPPSQYINPRPLTFYLRAFRAVLLPSHSQS
jgi:hypothetical protein